MVGACTRSSNRAIIMMLYEGGFRIGEIGGMKWGDLTFDKWGVIANVNFKTGQAPVRPGSSCPARPWQNGRTTIR